VTFLLELEGLLRGQAKLTYGQVVLVGIFGAFIGCGFYSGHVTPIAPTWWGPLASLLPTIVWWAGACASVKMMPAFRSPFCPVEAYRTTGRR